MSNNPSSFDATNPKTPHGILALNDCQTASGDKDRTARIRELNDALRVKGIGGRIMLTRSIAALEQSAIEAILHAVRSFTAFNHDNDPRGEHDCAILEVGGRTIMFKIDYYDRSMQWHSSDAANPTITNRVLTVMFADDY